MNFIQDAETFLFGASRFQVYRRVRAPSTVDARRRRRSLALTLLRSLA